MLIHSEIGKRLANRRKELSMTASELAKKADCTRGTISNIESGKRSLTIDNLYLFANILNCSAHDLLPKSNKPLSRKIEVVEEYFE